VFGEAVEDAVTQGWGTASIVLLILSVALIWFGFRRISRETRTNQG